MAFSFLTELKEDKVKEQKPSKPKVDGEELYAANFETYKDESMNPTSRSDEDELTAYEKFQLFYWEEKKMWLMAMKLHHSIR